MRDGVGVIEVAERRCVERGLPPLDSLVVHVAGTRQNWPGAGYFKVNGLPDERGERVREDEMIKATRFWELGRFDARTKQDQDAKLTVASSAIRCSA